MRVALGGLLHESNTFAEAPTEAAAFLERAARGAEIRAQWTETHHEVAGFLEGGDAEGFELCGTFMAGVTPGGAVPSAAYEVLIGELLEAVRACGAVDGMLLALHGAMVSEEYPDADGETLRRVRQALGPDVPLVVTLDFHANVSDAMVEHSTALLAYRTNPHVDQRPRGVQAARLLGRILRGEVRPVQALARPPMAWDILHQNTSAEPLRSVMAEAAALETSDELLAANVWAGYPYADVWEMGPSVVVVADGDEARARAEAERLSGLLWAARDGLKIRLPGPAEAVERARVAVRTPVVLVEMGDNIGGGSPGDSTAILAELVRQRAPGAVSVIYDPSAAAACAEAGIGAPVRLDVGGKTDRLHGEPVAIEGRVRSLHDGRFLETEPRHGGATRWDQGLTAVVELAGEGWGEESGPLVVLNSRRTAPMSLHQLISLGIVPDRQRVLVVKAAIAYRAAYEPIADEIIEVNSPGITAVDPRDFRYERVRRPIWPLDAVS